jgi:hypothetical protein
MFSNFFIEFIFYLCKIYAHLLLSLPCKSTQPCVFVNNLINLKQIHEYQTNARKEKKKKTFI